MNTPVNFELAKLLSKKGYNEPTLDAYVYRGIEHQDSSYKGILTKNKLICDISAPTIADVVMWLYEKHGIWITVDWSFSERKPSTEVKWSFSISNVGNREKCVELGIDTVWHNSPTEAYENAIEYTLKNLMA